MSDLNSALERCALDSAWIFREGLIGLDDLKSVYRRQRFGTNDWWVVSATKARVPTATLDGLVGQLRPALHELVHPETDRVGSGLFDLTGGTFEMKEPTVTQFAENLVKPAAVLGADRVADLVTGWINGEPLRFQQKALLVGLDVKRTLVLEEGVSIEKLPTSGTELPSSLPFHLDEGPLRYLGGVVLSFECEARPALYLPPDKDAGFGDRHTSTTVASGMLANADLGAFCQSLSLAGNHYVDWQSQWTDLGDVQVFSQMPGGGGSFQSVDRFLPNVEFTQDSMEAARDIHATRQQLTKPVRGLDTAIRRWAGSKRRSSHVDQLIELRIALEALYLKDAAGEKQYRLATYGSWHLGDGFAERRRIFRAIRKTYRAASNAVHAETVEPTEEHREALKSAQDICRDGILKRLGETQEPEWDDLALGASMA